MALSLNDDSLLARLGAVSAEPAVDRSELSAQTSTELARARTKVADAKKMRARIAVLNQVSLFKDMSRRDVERAAEEFTEVAFEAGQAVMTQGDIGDEFFIISSGEADVLYTPSNGEGDKLLATIGKNKFFGELALLTDEPRSATIRAADTGHLLVCMRMKRADFKKLFSSESSAVTVANSANLRERKAWEVLSNLPLFSSMGDVQIREMVTKMKMVKYEPGTYIVNEGREGRSFYIILEGVVKITRNDAAWPGGQGRPLTELSEDDYFGEVALLSKDQLRTANIITLTPCVCFTLEREHFIDARTVSIVDELNKRSYFRDMEALGNFNRKGYFGERSGVEAGKGVAEHIDKRPVQILRRHARMLVTALGHSLITQVFKELCLARGSPFAQQDNGEDVHDFGTLFANAFITCPARCAFTRRVRSILAKVAANKRGRGFNELSMLRALWEQSEDALDVHFATWPAPALLDVARHTDIKILAAGQALYDITPRQSLATRAYMVVRGAVALFRLDGTHEENATPGCFVCGEAFDEPADAKRVPLRHRAIALTNCVIFYLDYRDYFKVQGHIRSGSVFGVEEKFDLIELMPLFHDVDPEQLYLVAYAVQELHVPKGSIVLQEGETAGAIYFVKEGAIAVHADRFGTASSMASSEHTSKSSSSKGHHHHHHHRHHHHQDHPPGSRSLAASQSTPALLGTSRNFLGGGFSSSSSSSPSSLASPSPRRLRRLGASSKAEAFSTIGSAPSPISPVAGITLTTLHRGDYFGESGVLTQTLKHPRGESAMYYAKTAVDLFVLKPDKYNLLDPLALKKLERNYEVRAAWRRSRSRQDPFAPAADPKGLNITTPTTPSTAVPQRTTSSSFSTSIKFPAPTKGAARSPTANHRRGSSMLS